MSGEEEPEVTEEMPNPELVPGSVQWLGEMVRIQLISTNEAKHRFWSAADEVARLRRDLSAAEERLATEERGYHDSGKFMHELWDQLRADLGKQRSPAQEPVEVSAAPIEGRTP